MIDAFLILLLLQITPAQPIEFPEEFRSTWDLREDACAEPSSSSRMTIEAGSISFPGGPGRLVELFTAAEGDIYVALDMSAEEERWREQLRFVIGGPNEEHLFLESPSTVSDFRAFYNRCSVDSAAEF